MERRSQRSRRIIPALAGNTSGGTASARRPGDHPRSRGEYAVACAPTTRSVGSSPLSRGIPSSCIYYYIPLRIIPALAGNTGTVRSLQPGTRDHPRSRGEYSCGSCRFLSWPGSSPLSRGILGGLSQMASGNRIIPALAGNTLLNATATRTGGDHPRSRGEYTATDTATHANPGSSPLSRGIRPLGALPHRNGRIIPALAGNTPCRCWNATSTTDHPRSRGEYPAFRFFSDFLYGSSPLSRGIPVRSDEFVHLVRIIPALAGNTRPAQEVNILDWDHPRSRGEYTAIPI